jgi:hypothetical protein
MNHFAMPFYIFKLLCLAELSYFRLWTCVLLINLVCASHELSFYFNVIDFICTTFLFLISSSLQCVVRCKFSFSFLQM